jgi:hypothetical protein
MVSIAIAFSGPSDNSLGRIRPADQSRWDGVIEAKATDARRSMGLTPPAGR